jgi:uracil-DNA glycosylase family 4
MFLILETFGMDLPVFNSLQKMLGSLVECRKCRRLVKFREEVMPRKRALAEETYWRRPVPGFGDEGAWLLIVGLAPSAEGGNRTGRIFTGDESARFLFRMLHAEGFANQSFSERAGDGLRLKECYITAAVKCVPPDNKPTVQECDNCSVYLWNEMRLLRKLSAVLVLGGIALGRFLHYVKGQGGRFSRVEFKHGGTCVVEGFPKIYMSYHPSPQNTNTGKLTGKMFIEVLRKIKSDREGGE